MVTFGGAVGESYLHLYDGSFNMIYDHEVNTDDLEEVIASLIHAWQDGKTPKDAVIGPIQALARILVFAHDVYARLEGLNDEQQFTHLGDILIEEQKHVHERSVTITKPHLDS